MTVVATVAPIAAPIVSTIAPIAAGPGATIAPSAAAVASTIAPIAPTAAKASRGCVLCVDDEPAVLEGLRLHLGRKLELLTAPSGAAGLAILERRDDVEVVVSDMRMPVMDGGTFLAAARKLRPDAVRMLLTGDTDVRAAVSAVNDGQIFRFLVKPTPPAILLSNVAAAREHHRLITAERVLLERTLHGCIQTLADVLALTSPAAFGRSMRVKSLVAEVAAALCLAERWQVEVAAMLSQLGAITLPPETLDKTQVGRPLDPDERAMVERLPAVVEQLLAPIPRLEPVRAILLQATRDVPRPTDPAALETYHRARLLRAALDYDVLATRGVPALEVLATLRQRVGRYDHDVLDALSRVHRSTDVVREISASALRAGMVLRDDLRLAAGTLLAATGYEVTEGLLARVRNFRPGAIREPVRVVVRA